MRFATRLQRRARQALVAVRHRRALLIRLALRHAAERRLRRIARNPHGYVALQLMVRPAVEFGLGATPGASVVARVLCWALWRIAS